jgi:hypothetical protein
MTLLKGNYFPYCQICKYDGNCELKHYEFLGIKPKGEVDKTPYKSHEDVAWPLSAFQTGSDRAACTGRINETGSIYYPLACECGTAISSLTFSKVLGASLCQKFEFDGGKRVLEKVAVAKELARKRHKAWVPILVSDILDNPYDANYYAVMTH